ncbi:DUF4174 domain-containing protein [Paracoccus beibuensis]|uniref:DUF4174 domain-containing protein n=1 Tax=Paracoccus beibuensis TaxID=547602 RepID=UPI00223FA3CE|nr:DUF4174 domain-containing protein [Paracoccus beibuensis]
MKLRVLIFMMVLAAMGPGRDAPPPDPDSVVQRNPARLPPVSRQPSAADDVVTPLALPAPPLFEASAVEPQQFLWEARPVVVFADTPEDPAFVEQIEALTGDGRALLARDVVIVTDSDPAANSIWRQQLRPRGFSLVLLDKDGQVKIRRPTPWDAREIGRAIDRLPLRRQESDRGNVLR